VDAEDVMWLKVAVYAAITQIGTRHVSFTLSSLQEIYTPCDILISKYWQLRETTLSAHVCDRSRAMPLNRMWRWHRRCRDCRDVALDSCPAMSRVQSCMPAAYLTDGVNRRSKSFAAARPHVWNNPPSHLTTAHQLSTISANPFLHSRQISC